MGVEGQPSFRVFTVVSVRIHISSEILRQQIQRSHIVSHGFCSYLTLERVSGEKWSHHLNEMFSHGRLSLAKVNWFDTDNFDVN